MANPISTTASYELNLEEYWNIILRRREVILFCALALGSFSWLFTWMNQPPALYSSNTSVRIEKSTDMTGLMMQSIAFSAVDDMGTQLALIKSYFLMERVARRMGMIPENLSDADIRKNAVYMDKILGLKNNIEAKQEGASGIINITTTSGSPEFARDLAQTVAEEFRQLNIEEKNKRVTEAKRFIQLQLKVVSDRLKKAEDAVRTFREENKSLMAGRGSAALSRIGSEQEDQYRKQALQLNIVEFAMTKLQERMNKGPWDYKPVSVDDPVSPYFTQLNARLVAMAVKRTELATDFTDEHPAIKDLQTQGNDVLVSMVDELKKQAAQIKLRMVNIQQSMEETALRYRDVPEQELLMRRLERQVVTNEQLYTVLEGKFQEVQIKEAEKVEEVSLVRPALVSHVRINPARTTQTAVAGIILGLVLGLIIALIIEAMDSSVGTIEEVESYIGSSVVGFVPNLARDEAAQLFSGVQGLATSGHELERQIRLVTHFAPPSTISEAYRSLRTNLMFSKSGENRVVLVSSSTMQEGKSTVASNLAIVYAQQGARVLLIDGDMHKPMQHKTFGLDREPGLSEYLLGQIPWQDAVRHISDVLLGDFGVDQALMTPGLDQLDIMTCGRQATNPAGLLATPVMDQFLVQAREDYDMVILDMPPLLHTTDASVLATKVDGVLLVYHIGSVVRSALKRVKTGIEAVGGTVIGIVLNGVRGELSPDFSKYKVSKTYAYAYGDSKGKHDNWLDQANDEVRKVIKFVSNYAIEQVYALLRKFKK
ncbi:MAG: hypothetical protein COW19_11240 [Zetaproteobacteria bacterium CG12_big_fil_rev_8_21_14_0_65_55_1124]|nr:MAG: hypothetical protein AUJ58_04460 [Zetaproteobacteria bacterium CG1_02_55_237]PIS18897.1 MAG: hypothetical protein COT53_08515 [Zetaproteobacteria bacterium CG08_land_8_20_14_0_20_55_17]PIW41854.1 MAG: hypothetical protein COW19_11240 [Zetaproteobacteria bacterium CG12_big_fil_rev_8_21_14_0_65_55_1124]PIY53461.1 MAG: hypothetical protein COZ01_03770 [Zetaproteobacteria bacterium CG_4_10_14_0_8_um_filter_55_43]PIZ39485.1 MAG: hypothetical protein COY36_02860 [Zetaproteobacteria bacterium 